MPSRATLMDWVSVFIKFSSVVRVVRAYVYADAPSRSVRPRTEQPLVKAQDPTVMPNTLSMAPGAVNAAPRTQDGAAEPRLEEALLKAGALRKAILNSANFS